MLTLAFATDDVYDDDDAKGKNIRGSNKKTTTTSLKPRFGSRQHLLSCMA